MSEIGYRTVAYWYPFHDGYTPEDITEIHPTLAEAEHSGQHWGCLRGVRRVEVFSPDGTLQALWDKESTEVIRSAEPWWVDEETGEETYDYSHVANRWQRLGAESVALGKVEVARATATLRAQGRMP